MRTLVGATLLLVACAGEPTPAQTPTTTASATPNTSASASASGAPAASTAAPATAVGPTTAAMKAEALKVLGVIARNEVEAYERENVTSDLKSLPQSLCPSARAVPASLDALKDYKPNDADFANDPGWKCLRFTLVANAPFQFEVVVDKDVAHIFARRPDVELELVAKVEKKHVVVASAPIERAR